MLDEFDFGYNMLVMMGLAQVFICVNLRFCWLGLDSRPYVWRLLLFLSLLSAAFLLEVFDFPPVYGVVDAHALWHAATAGLGWLWYAYCKDDAAWENGGSAKAEVALAAAAAEADEAEWAVDADEAAERARQKVAAMGRIKRRKRGKAGGGGGK